MSRRPAIPVPPERARWLADVLDGARRALTALGLPPERAPMIAAHAAVSTGWGKRVAGNNLFGMKAGPAWTGPVTETLTHEYVNGRRVQTRARWRAYPNLQSAIRGYLDLVLGLPRYAEAATALRAGSQEYMAALGRGGWYTAPIPKVDADWRRALGVIVS